MSSNKRGLIMRTLLTSNYGGCGCGKPKPSEVHQPTPIPIPKIPLNYHNTTTTHVNPTTTSLTSSTTSTGDRNDDDEDLSTSTTVSETDTATHQDHNKKGTTTIKNSASFLLRPSPKIVDDSVAVEKESKDPYRDFRYSMLQMIFEKEIFSESGLQELLQCFLELNAPCHHHVIVQVFMEICQETFPKKSRGHDGDSDGGGGGGGGGGGEPSSCRSELARARN